MAKWAGWRGGDAAVAVYRGESAANGRLIDKRWLREAAVP